MSEAPHDEEQREDELAEQRPLPLVQSLTYGTGTFLAVGAVDLLAHLGPTGLVVGGIVAYAAAKHGPELVEQVRENLPSPASRPASRRPRKAVLEQRGSGNSAKSKRSFLDRALGRFPVEDEAETVFVDEPEDPPPASSSQSSKRRFAHIIHPICLSPDLVVEADETVGAGINIFGLKGSGKTGAAARLAEQFAPYYVAEVLFDSKGDFRSLVTDRRPNGRPYVPNGVIGVRGHAPRGRSVLSLGLQVVYDLRTWETLEQRANIICAVVEELLETVAHTPQDEEEPAPCLVFLDEAEYWLPQNPPSYLYPRTARRLLDAFHTLATMGRSLGLAPVIVTQRIAKVNKDIIAEAEMHLFLKAELDIDLDRYYDYFDKRLISRERIRSFQAGEAVVCLPDGSQHLTRLLKRESKHTSHTPHVTASLARFAGRSMRGPIELDPQAGGMPPTPPVAPPATGSVPSADQAPPRHLTMPPERQPAPLPEQMAHLWQPPQAGTQDLRPVEPFQPSANRISQHAPSVPAMRPLKARLTPELEQALAAFQQGAITARPLADALKAQGIQCGKDKAAALLRRLRELGEIP